MIEVRFYDQADEASFRYAVIVSRHRGKWVLCKHRQRDTLEVPGGHREAGEDILETARRELVEETGAVEFLIQPVSAYSVIQYDDENVKSEVFGKLFYADIMRYEDELHNEIEKIVLMDELPENWTYPLIQPKLVEKTIELGFVI